ncbi:hypothetical protein AAV35_012705 [Salimicrobium jeotgali]|uniref:DUF4054 domain-containing protein n=1 Tax=Salimicrobium jeotgali TaxID=1230341 RepID=K2H3N6_9BACI|nr:DUF4054 domain-containing protein [Salimicrobium jeotgali]AKG05526.1 hypothetical protein AAV35_012705 [Salimicrobium jeotgali]EKE30485.1 hypothetical protein MJ3_13629 [Salimicrobium jeotgali]MBM7696633.1 hypothetical protein [Salimicrobium jeotgali]
MDPLTTADKVKSIATHLDTMPNESIDIYIEDASLEVSSSGIKERYQERAARYLAAHMASLNVRQASTQKVGEVSQTFSGAAGGGISATPYGEEYKRILSKFKARPSLNLTVL